MPLIDHLKLERSANQPHPFSYSIDIHFAEDTVVFLDCEAGCLRPGKHKLGLDASHQAVMEEAIDAIFRAGITWVYRPEWGGYFRHDLYSLDKEWRLVKTACPSTSISISVASRNYRLYADSIAKHIPAERLSVDEVYQNGLALEGPDSWRSTPPHPFHNLDQRWYYENDVHSYEDISTMWMAKMKLAQFHYLAAFIEHVVDAYPYIGVLPTTPLTPR
jgi:hypothetical protein